MSLLEQQKQQAEAAAKAASPTVATAAAQHARLERKIALLTKERNGLKQILQSYEEEDMAAAQDPGEHEAAQDVAVVSSSCQGPQ